MGGLPPALRLVGIGWYIAFCIAFGVGGGVWLDRTLDISPLFTLIGLFLGLALALYGGYRMLMDVVLAEGARKKG
jgi:ATP synthase protein I